MCVSLLSKMCWSDRLVEGRGFSWDSDRFGGCEPDFSSEPAGTWWSGDGVRCLSFPVHLEAYRSGWQLQPSCYCGARGSCCSDREETLNLSFVPIPQLLQKTKHNQQTSLTRSFNMTLKALSPTPPCYSQVTTFSTAKLLTIKKRTSDDFSGWVSWWTHVRCPKKDTPASKIDCQ